MTKKSQQSKALQLELNQTPISDFANMSHELVTLADKIKWSLF